MDSMEIRDDETVIEIGAGTGLLTGLLAERATRLIAVELDERLASRLGERFAGCDNVAVLASDVLEISPGELLTAGGGSMPYVVVGNLPYFIGTAIVRQFLEATVRPRRLVVTLQAEVAESMTAPPGRMSYLGVEVQTLAMAKVLFRLAPRAFNPPPKVRSAVVRLDLLEPAEVEVDDRDAFLSLVRAGFAAPRKRLRNSLAIGLRMPTRKADAIIERAGLDGGRRAADRSPGDGGARPVHARAARRVARARPGGDQGDRRGAARLRRGSAWLTCRQSAGTARSSASSSRHCSAG